MHKPTLIDLNFIIFILIIKKKFHNFYLLFYKHSLEIYGRKFISCASYLSPTYANNAKLSEDN